MATPINLNKARKAKAKTAQLQQASENRAKHGRTKAEKAQDRAETVRLRKTLDDAQSDD